MHDENTVQRFIELRAQGWTYARLITELNMGELTTPQLHALARTLRRQIEHATGPLRFTSPVSEIPAAEYHDQVQDWQG